MIYKLAEDGTLWRRDDKDNLSWWSIKGVWRNETTLGVTLEMFEGFISLYAEYAELIMERGYP